MTIWYWACLPAALFSDPYSTVLESREGKLLGATLASDGQWRFPQDYRTPEKFKRALITFEDKRFSEHLGVDLLALGRATRQNLQSGRIVSGGSTITMQVVRLSRKNKPRTLLEKAVEIMLATRLEFALTKEEILDVYAAHAPFGGNVVGLEAACWRYFGRDASSLSWSEAAMLSVLPNNPSLVHPGRNRDALRKKRDHLLKRLLVNHAFDFTTYRLAIAEPLPDKPLPLPRVAPHLLTRTTQDGHAGLRIVSTVDHVLQGRLGRIMDEHHDRLKGNLIFNAAALVLDVNTGQVLAYTGNVAAGPDHGEDVDIIQARRSTGSILKPFLYAALLDEGKILPRTIQPDIPTLINGFSPMNFTRSYDGAVPADKALIRSLNIPAVHALSTYRYEKFYHLLKELGLSTLDQPADHYGLSLILGGAEATLWDLTGAYASMARTLHTFNDPRGRPVNTFLSPSYLATPTTEGKPSPIRAGAIHTVFEVLKELYRPGESSGWKLFNSSREIAWKSGTSHGYRDGWAIGLNGEYVVGVWTGNADGEGRPGLTGTDAAAPILFDIFSSLPGRSWFDIPDDLIEINTCSESGMRASELCPKIVKEHVPATGLGSAPCRYHQLVHLSQDGRFRVHGNCESISMIRTEPWFVLPPVQEYFYRSKKIGHKPLPPVRSDCANSTSVASMDLIYPRPGARIKVPRELDGSQGNTLFEAAHRQSSTSIYWHLDGQYLGVTKGTHKIPVSPKPGDHVLTLVDDRGAIKEQRFHIME